MPKPVTSCASLLIMFLTLWLQACGSSAQASQEKFDALVKSKLGSNYTIAYNDSKHYALCQQSNGSGDHAYRAFKFVVVKIATNTITDEGSFQNGYVKWINDNSLEISSSTMTEKRETKTLRINDQQS